MTILSYNKFFDRYTGQIIQQNNIKNCKKRIVQRSKRIKILPIKVKNIIIKIS